MSQQRPHLTTYLPPFSSCPLSKLRTFSPLVKGTALFTFGLPAFTSLGIPCPSSERVSTMSSCFPAGKDSSSCSRIDPEHGPCVLHNVAVELHLGFGTFSFGNIAKADHRTEKGIVLFDRCCCVFNGNGVSILVP